MTGKYMAYVGSYSYTGKAKGITVYDVDVETGKFIYRCEVEVDNSSYLKASQNGQILYSIADEGVVAFRVLPNGSLARLNSANIRACADAISQQAKPTTISLSPVSMTERSRSST